MRLEQFAISNFKRVGDLEIHLRNHLVLIGANDVGKTSVLRALDLLLGSTAQIYSAVSVADIRDLEQTLAIRAVFVDFDVVERALFHREITVAPDDHSESLEVRLEVKVDPEDVDSVLISRFCPGRGEPRNITREQISAIGWRYLPALRPLSAAHFDGASGAIHTLLRAVESELGDERSALAALLESFNKKLETNPALQNLRGGMAKQLSSSMPKAIAAEDLAVRTATDPSTSVLEDASMYLRREGTFVPLSEQSDGIRQLISMTLFDLAEGAANVIAVDEPELHLHPSSQRTVAEMLSASANQKILVTHSPYVVQKFDPSQVVVVRADGSCQQIGPDRVPIEDRVQALWWSPKMLEALTARFVIVVEGLADRLVVEAAAGVLDVPLDRTGAVVLELGGSENFKSVYKLLGPEGFGVEILGLVDDAEKGPWLGAVGGKPIDVVGRTVFVSTADLEDEYCKALGAEALGPRLIASKVARDENALLSSCGVSSTQELTALHLAAYCRSNAGSGKGSRKVPSALVVAKSLTRSEAEKIVSIHDLLTVLADLASA